MNIVLVSEFFPRSEIGELRGGAEARTFYLVKHLSQSHTITVLSSFEDGMDRIASMFDGTVTVLRCGKKRTFAQSGSLFARASFMFAAWRYLRTLHGDIVDAQSFITYVPVWFGARYITQRVITVHDVWIHEWVRLFGLSGIVGELYERLALHRQWDVVIANSKATQARLQEVGVARERVHVVYNGYDAHEVPAHPTHKNDRLTVCYVGRLVEYKRVQDLLFAIAELRQTVPTICLKIVGVGPYGDTLREVVRRLHLQQHVEFVGHVASHIEVLRIVQSSHVFSLPSVVEGFGMVTVEAMAVGTPFVNADIPVMHEVTADQGGLFFSPYDTHQLASQLRKILTDTVLAQKLVSEGKERATSFRWEYITRQLEQIYSSLIHKDIPT